MATEIFVEALDTFSIGAAHPRKPIVHIVLQYTPFVPLLP
jgi:hypothetical protein